MSFLRRSASDPRLEAVLARLCQKLGDLWTTHAVKLPYLVDLVAQHVLGRCITKSHHKAWKLGVVTARAWGLVTKERGGDHFDVYGDPIVDGVRISLRDESALEELAPEELAIVDFVAKEYGGLSPSELGDLTKEINPEIRHWGGRDLVPLTEAAYKRLPIWFGENEADAEIATRVARAVEDGRKQVIPIEDLDYFLSVPSS